jgi:bacterioferritin-associated ferredoxin
MYVCVCNAVTDSDIRTAVADGVRNLRQLKRATGCSSTCGCCRQEVVDVLQQALAEKRDARSLLPVIQVA